MSENSGIKRVKLAEEKSEALKALGKEVQGLYASLGKIEEEHQIAKSSLIQEIEMKKSAIKSILAYIKKEMNVQAENFSIDVDAGEAVIEGK